MLNNKIASGSSGRNFQSYTGLTLQKLPSHSQSYNGLTLQKLPSHSLKYRHISHFHPPSLFLVPLHFSETNISFPSCLRNLLSLYIFFSQSDSLFFCGNITFHIFQNILFSVNCLPLTIVEMFHLSVSKLFTLFSTEVCCVKKVSDHLMCMYLESKIFDFGYIKHQKIQQRGQSANYLLYTIEKNPSRPKRGLQSY